MGYNRHHAIIVTSYDKNIIEAAHEKAKEIFKHLACEIIESKINSYYSFFIATDGSKEGWTQSNDGDENRALFIDFIQGKVGCIAVFLNKSFQSMATNNKSTNLCKCCNVNKVEEGLHQCPYEADINHNEELFCNCCDDCSHQCAMDI